LRVTAGTSARWLEGQASPSPPPTAFVLRHAGIRRRMRRSLGLSSAAARARPSRRAMLSSARTARLLRPSQHSNPGLRKDSTQTHPFSWQQTRHTFPRTMLPARIARARLVPSVLPNSDRAPVPLEVRALSQDASGQIGAAGCGRLEANGGGGGVGAIRHRREPR
jgi:hypothetical protein